MNLPDRITDAVQLEECLSRPSPSAVTAMGRLSGDLILLGVGGKMGPSLARMARRASEEAGVSRRIIGVSRFSQPAARASLEAAGVETIAGDLLDDQFVRTLPQCENVVYMTGVKFGTEQNPGLTWAINTWTPGLVCRRFADSRILAFSSGNIYGYVRPESGGSRETDLLQPVGEYAASVLGRERIFQHFSIVQNMPVTLLRLNYACELRYGVLVDLARQVSEQVPIDVTMGFVNAIWQGDANAMSLAALVDAECPPKVINVAGPETLLVREVADKFGQLLGLAPDCIGIEAADALLSNSSEACHRYGMPQVGIERLIRWIADWIQTGGELWEKPTHFQNRDGGF